MAEKFSAARAGWLDGVLMRISVVDYDAHLAAVRLDLEQQEIDKGYVDLTARDALWLAYSLLRAADHLVTDVPVPSALDGAAER
jgi:hypothetical protein